MGYDKIIIDNIIPNIIIDHQNKIIRESQTDTVSMPFGKVLGSILIHKIKFLLSDRDRISYENYHYTINISINVEIDGDKFTLLNKLSEE